MNIKDVARMAGVSISTISRVINKSAYVSPEIAERIEKILAETGYRPNALAKELLRNKTNTIGVMLSMGSSIAAKLAVVATSHWFVVEAVQRIVSVSTDETPARRMLSR